MSDKGEQQALSTATANSDDRAMLTKAQEIVDLFQTAIKLGYSITFSLEQMRVLIAICEEGYLIKERKSRGKRKRSA
jgi:glucose uptake protein GlcU